MDSDDFYEAEHFYNEDGAETGSDSAASGGEEDLSKLGYFELAKRFHGKKELPKVQAEKPDDFPPIEKNLYVQVREITNMLDHEVIATRRANGPIRVRGKNPPRPILNFAQAGLPEAITKYLARKGISKPFPIQMQAIPALLCGRDVVAIAQTGQGKTLAYLLPMLRHVLCQAPLRIGDGPIGLVIAPTRELALQIHKQLVPLAELMRLRTVCAYGGAPIGEQLGKLKAQCEILVATPGRLIDVLTASRGKLTNLRRTSMFVMDEADRLFDMGFGPQVSQVLAALNPKGMVCMFSATFPPHVEGLARQHLKKPLEILVGDGGAGTVGSNIQQSVDVLKSDQDRLMRTLQLLGEWCEHGSIIIFVQSKDEVDSLFASLLKHGYGCLTIHGGQDQADRDSTIDDFKHRKPPNILIATSVAARGLDVKHCILVINYRVPEHLDDYIHRVGRTGRAGQPGFAFTFICPDEADKADGLIEALKSSGQHVPVNLIGLAQQHQAQVSLGLARKRMKWGGSYSSGHGYRFDASEKSRAQAERSMEHLKKVVGAEDDDQDLIAGSVKGPVTGVSAVGMGGPVPPPPPPSSMSFVPKAPPPPGGLAKKPPPPPGPPLTGLGKRPPPPGPPVTGLVKPPPPPGPPVTGLVKTPPAVPVGSSAIVPLNGQSTSAGTEIALAGTVGASASTSATTQYFLTKMGGVVPVTPAPIGSQTMEFEINDYPELARAKGVTREFRTQLEERHGVKIQIKGQYLEPGKPIPPGARKLFVEISGNNRNAIARAHKEIFDNVEDVAIKTLNIPEDRLRKKPRYRTKKQKLA